MWKHLAAPLEVACVGAGKPARLPLHQALSCHASLDVMSMRLGAATALLQASARFSTAAGSPAAGKHAWTPSRSFSSNGDAAAAASASHRLDSALAELAAFGDLVGAKGVEDGGAAGARGSPAVPGVSGAVPLQLTAKEALQAGSKDPEGMAALQTLVKLQEQGWKAEPGSLLSQLPPKDLYLIAQALYKGVPLRKGGSGAGSPAGQRVFRDVTAASRLWLQGAARGDPMCGLQVAFCLMEAPRGVGRIPYKPQAAKQLLRPLAMPAALAQQKQKEQQASSPSPSPSPPVLKRAHPWAEFALASLLLRERIAEATGIWQDKDKGASSAEQEAAKEESASSGSGRDSSLSSRQLSSMKGLQQQQLRLIPAAMRQHHPDCKLAFQLLQNAAAAAPPLPTVPPALLNLSSCFRLGVGCPQDLKEANAWLSRAAKAGDPLAAAQLASLYALKAVLRPPTAAAASSTSLAPAAAQGEPAPLLSPSADAVAGQVSRESSEEAINAAAALLLPDDAGASERLWRMAAEAGLPSAMHNLALSYLQREERKAAALAAAADAGEKRAELEKEGKPSAATALLWFKRAAGAGFVPSMLNAGLILQRGHLGVAREGPAALQLFQQALTAMERAAAARTGAGAGPSALQQRLQRRVSLLQQELQGQAVDWSKDEEEERQGEKQGQGDVESSSSSKAASPLSNKVFVLSFDDADAAEAGLKQLQAAQSSAAAAAAAVKELERKAGTAAAAAGDTSSSKGWRSALPKWLGGTS